MIIELMIVEMVFIFLMMSHHHQINDAVFIKLMIVEKGLYSYSSLAIITLKIRPQQRRQCEVNAKQLTTFTTKYTA